MIGAGSRTNQLQLWDPRITSGKSRQSEEGGQPGSPKNMVASGFAHKGSLTAVKWHPFREFTLLTTAKDQLIYQWDIRRPRISSDPDHEQNWTPSRVRKSTLIPPIHSNGSRVPGCPVAYSGIASRRNIFESIRNIGVLCPWCSSPPTPTFTEHEINKSYPVCVDWHPRSADAFVVGCSSGFLTFWQDGECLARISHTPPIIGQNLTGNQAAWSQVTTYGMNRPQVDDLIWHPNGSTLISTTGGAPGLNGTVCFWRRGDQWSELTGANLCAHSCHIQTD